jgi:hypothetical protein
MYKPPKECGRCHAKNSPLEQFCHCCGLTLDVKSALEVDGRAGQVEGLDTMKAEIANLKEELVRQKAFEEYVRKKLRTPANLC